MGLRVRFISYFVFFWLGTIRFNRLFRLLASGLGRIRLRIGFVSYSLSAILIFICSTFRSIIFYYQAKNTLFMTSVSNSISKYDLIKSMQLFNLIPGSIIPWNIVISSISDIKNYLKWKYCMKHQRRYQTNQ